MENSKFLIELSRSEKGGVVKVNVDIQGEFDQLLEMLAGTMAQDQRLMLLVAASLVAYQSGNVISVNATPPN